MFSKPATMKEAIELTLVLHQMVIDGEYGWYSTAKNMEFGGKCPLCLYATNNTIRCELCPWHTIQGESLECEPCSSSDLLDFHDSEQSIKRLNSWLKGKKYIPEESNNV